MGKKYYLLLAAVVSPLKRAQNIESIHPKFSFSMYLGSFNHYLDSTLSTCYSFGPYGEFVDVSCVANFCQ
jgi:hypothetical protein